MEQRRVGDEMKDREGKLLAGEIVFEQIYWTWEDGMLI